MTTTKGNILKTLHASLAPGTPLTARDLANLGVSADLAVYYVRAGWLQRLARGVYCRPNDPPALHPSLLLLQRSLEGLHVSGKSALDWHGIRHYVSARPILQLCGWRSRRLPGWFTDRFPSEYRRIRIFEEEPEALLQVRPYRNDDNAPLVSAPERAVLEMLSEVGTRQPLQEARELIDSAYTLRVDVLQDLLKRCTSIKTVRLCLNLGRELSLPWATRLDPTQLPTGSSRPWVSRSAEGVLVLRP